jgi:hypothetical protein
MMNVYGPYKTGRRSRGRREIIWCSGKYSFTSNSLALFVKSTDIGQYKCDGVVMGCIRAKVRGR